MSFLNATWLLGLLSLIVPILLHLQKRKPKTMEWAAVRFLKNSLISRRRGIILEHFLLLFCRCMLLATFVFAIARPWTNHDDSALYGMPGIALILGLGLVVLSVTLQAAWQYRVLTGCSGSAMIIVALAMTWHHSETSSIAGTSSCDVVLIIDGTDSMGISSQNATPVSSSLFSNAVAEAQRFLAQLPTGSTATYLVVDDDSSFHENRLRADIPLLRKQLESLAVPGGVDDLGTSIERARSILKNGTNPRQQILILTDDQLTNWQSISAREVNRGDAVEETGPIVSTVQLVDHPTGLLAKVFHLPDSLTNLAVSNIEVEERAWRVGEKARVGIEIFNGGTKTSDEATVEFYCNDKLKQTWSIGTVPPGVRRLIPTEMVWEQPGSCSISARINNTDDLPNDNEYHRAVLVQQAIKVLIIDGEEADPEHRRSAHYLRLALNNRLVELDSVSINEWNSEFPLDRFETIYLCNVSKLEDSLAGALARYVDAGGGMIVLLGPGCDPEFYNPWQIGTARVMPLTMQDYVESEQNREASLGLDWASAHHPAIKPWLTSGQHDLSDWKFHSYWRTVVADPANLADDRAAMKFLNGELFLAEHSLGRGRVLAQTSSPTPLESNLINRISFPVWHHLLTRHIARSEVIGLHQKPSLNWTAEIPIIFDEDALKGSPQQTPFTAVLTNPKGKQKTISLNRDGRFFHADLGKATYPGLYSLEGPFGKSFSKESWRLSVHRDAIESDLSRCTNERIRTIATNLGMELLIDDAQWVQAASGVAMKTEWWSLFAYSALTLLVAESLVLRWLARKRGYRGLSMSWVYLAIVGLSCWFVWWQGWRVTGEIADIQYSKSIAGVAGLIACLSCVVAATYWDGFSGQSTRPLTMIKLARLLQLGVIGFMLLEPFSNRESETHEKGTIAILWDRSQSMSVSEGQATREGIAKQVLWGDKADSQSMLDNISLTHNVQLYQYAASSQLIDHQSIAKRDNLTNIVGRDEDQAWNNTTNLSDALQRVFADTPMELLSGIIVVSDGCDRSSISPEKVASQLADHKTPIHAVVIGDTTPIPDAAVAALHAPNQIYLKDQVTVNANLHFDRLRGETATIRFYRDEKLLSSKTVSIVSDAQRTSVQFEDLPDTIGMHYYQVKIDTLPAERISENNEREVSVWVTNDRLNLLIVEQRPRWEFRYLKNLFAGRDRNVSLQHVLLAPDRLAGVPDPFPIAASASRALDDYEANRLPKTELEWLKFDVIILGDIDPAELDEVAQQSLEKFVSQRGGTLVIIAGPNSMPHQFENSQLSKLLPAYKSTKTTAGSGAPYQFRLTAEGKSSSLMTGLAGEANQLESSSGSPWDRLPKLHWRHNHAIAKPGATVLAWADQAEHDEEVSRPDRDHKSALVLWHRYGGGRVLQLNFDQTWRLRYWNGDELHHRFWGRVVRWGTEDRLGLGTELVRLGVDKATYRVHDALTVNVRLVEDDSNQDLATDSVRCLLTRKEELISESPLQLVENSGGLMRAHFTMPNVPGRYRVQVLGTRVERLLAAENKAGQNVFAEFHVESNSPDAETNDHVASTAVLGPLTKQTGGLLLDPVTAMEVLGTFEKRTLEKLDQLTEPVWNSWPIVLVFLTLVLAEWIVRKKHGFI